jgi:hypothetical protein
MLVPGAVDPALGLAEVDGLVLGSLVGGFGRPVDVVGVDGSDVGVGLVVPDASGGPALLPHAARIVASATTAGANERRRRFRGSGRREAVMCSALDERRILSGRTNARPGRFTGGGLRARTYGA